MNDDSTNHPTTEAMFAAVRARKKNVSNEFADSVEQILGAAGHFAYKAQCLTMGDSDAQEDRDQAWRDLRTVVETRLRLASGRGKA